jgi:hypothetical protein
VWEDIELLLHHLEERLLTSRAIPMKEHELSNSEDVSIITEDFTALRVDFSGTTEVYKIYNK